MNQWPDGAPSPKFPLRNVCTGITVTLTDTLALHQDRKTAMAEISGNIGRSWVGGSRGRAGKLPNGSNRTRWLRHPGKPGLIGRKTRMATPTPTPTCPLCDGPATCAGSDFGRKIAVECERCGRFRITEEALDALKPEHKPLLSAYCRRLAEGGDIPFILSTTIDQFIRTLPQYTPPEKLDNLLGLMGLMSPALGKHTTFNIDRDYPLVIAEHPDEAYFLVTELLKRGYLDGTLDHFSLTLAGWERLEEIKKAGRLSNRAFVAMWFDKSMDDLYDNAIEPAIRDAGYDPLRMDKHEHVNRIDDEIIGQVKRSRFMVADFTGQRYGVYFEAGMMMGLGRTVIWLCDKKELDESKLHFDVRQFNFIAYESVEDAKTRLYNRILAIEGEGPGQFEKPG